VLIEASNFSGLMFQASRPGKFIDEVAGWIIVSRTFELRQFFVYIFGGFRKPPKIWAFFRLTAQVEKKARVFARILMRAKHK